MKRVLITGENSYIGQSFKTWISSYYATEITLDFISLKNEKWRKKNFSCYDAIVHVAAIVHSPHTDQKKYYEINRDLTYQIALKAKNEDVKQFIFISTMSVYGKTQGEIDQNTIENPTNHYGASKLEAETLLRKLEDESFFVSIIRPPMVYGKNCKGNYAKISKLTKKITLIPSFLNFRSMIYIDNLSEFLAQVLLRDVKGILYPQNREYVSTNKLMKAIAKNNHKVIFEISFFNFIISILVKSNLQLFNKLYGNLVYSKEISKYEFNYWVKNFEESIADTEKINHE